MKKSKKRYLFLIVSILIFGIVASCTKENQFSPENPTDGKNKEIESPEQEIFVFDILPPNDFKGETMKIYIPPNDENPVHKGTFCAIGTIGSYSEELTGDSFNDAVYNRNRKIEDEYNLKLEPVYGNSWSATYEELSKDVKSGDLRADVYFTHVFWNVASIVTGGYLRTWEPVSYIDQKKPWWNQTSIKNLNIANKTFFISGSVAIQDVILLAFNKQLLQALALESPYNLVRDKKWTLDKLDELAVAASADLDGDGVYNPREDRYGLAFCIDWHSPALMYACDEISATLDGKGYPQIELVTEKKIAAFDKIHNLLWEGNKTHRYNGAPNQGIDIDSGRVLFHGYNLFSIEKYLRSAEVEYGILPLPKYDEKQENYMTCSWTGMYSLPINIDESKFEMIGTVMESMAALGHTDVVPVYYDILLKEKISRDDDSRDMLDIILGNIVYDTGLVFQIGDSHPGNMIKHMFGKQEKTYVSEMEKSMDKILSDYDEMYNAILNLE
ncbi:MAG: extracellular solute-binding protein [Oscillospiraceae bacterium]|nr:extracellular solute-binding protein [Oscillospiraceae bacterium]